jgi:hypothetical protein
VKGLSLHICGAKIQLTGSGYFSDAKQEYYSGHYLVYLHSNRILGDIR